MSDIGSKIKKSFLGLILLVIVMNGGTIADGFGTNEGVEIKQFFLSHIFDYYGIMKRKALVMAMENMIFIIYFNLIFGNYIYVRFTQGSIFIFSRIQNRGKWLRKQTICLYGICVLFSFLYLMMQLGICIYSTKKIPDWECMKIFVQFWLIFTFILMISTYSINLLAIRFGMVKGFFCIYIIMLVLMKISLNYGNIAILKEHYILHLLNPMSATSLTIMDGKIIKLLAMMYYHFLIGGILFCFEKFIKKMDILRIIE